MENQPIIQIMSKEEGDAYMKRMSDPEYLKQRYEAMDRATEFMDLCNKGSGWIIDIHNFCEAHQITPDQLMDFYSEHKQSNL